MKVGDWSTCDATEIFRVQYKSKKNGKKASINHIESFLSGIALANIFYKVAL